MAFVGRLLKSISCFPLATPPFCHAFIYVSLVRKVFLFKIERSDASKVPL